MANNDTETRFLSGAAHASAPAALDGNTNTASQLYTQLGATGWPLQDIRLFETVAHESTIRSFPPPTCIAYLGGILLHDY